MNKIKLVQVLKVRHGVRGRVYLEVKVLRFFNNGFSGYESFFGNGEVFMNDY